MPRLSRSMSVRWCPGLLVALVLILPGLATAQATKADADAKEPLYLLTYDHGGLILWGRAKFADRLRDAISWLDRHPDFKIGLDNEAYIYDDLAEHDPKLLDELREDLKKYAGRFGIGTCTYGQPLSQFVNEESNIRQVVYALRTDQRRLGVAPRYYLMSEHAMHSQIPQILAGCGFQGAIMRTHFMMYGYNPTFDVPIGWWVGLDGTRIATVPTYPGEGASFGRTTADNQFLTRWPGPEAPDGPDEYRRRFSHIHPLLATRADDAPLRKEELVKRTEGRSEYRWILLEDLPAILPRPTAEMKTGPEDFHVRMPWGYCGNEILEREPPGRSRRAHRRAPGRARPHAWRRRSGSRASGVLANLLVGQHHDIQICGLLPDARNYLPASITASTRVKDKALQSLAVAHEGRRLPASDRLQSRLLATTAMDRGGRVPAQGRGQGVRRFVRGKAGSVRAPLRPPLLRWQHP